MSDCPRKRRAIRLFPFFLFLCAFVFSGNTYAFEGTAVFLGYGSPNRDSTIVYTVNLQSGAYTRLWAKATDWGYCEGACFTADGKQIVFQHEGSLYVMNNNGRSVRGVLSGDFMPGSWCVAANGVYYMNDPPDNRWQLYHVNLSDGVRTHIYTFNTTICEARHGTDISCSRDGTRLYSRTDISQIAGSTNCMHGNQAFMSINTDLSGFAVIPAFLWGHANTVSADGKYVYMIRWEVDPGFHRAMFRVSFDSRTVLDTIIPPFCAQDDCAMEWPPGICMNDDSLLIIGAGNPHIEHVYVINGLRPTSYSEVPRFPAYSRPTNFIKGAMPSPDSIAVLSLDKKSIAFSSLAGMDTQTVVVSNIGQATLDSLQTSNNATWLTVSASDSGGQSRTIVNTASISGLADGMYSDTVWVSGGGAANKVWYTVTLFVNVLAGPTSLAATATGDSLVDVQLTWVDNSTDEQGFAVERSSDSGVSWTAAAQTAANDTGWLDTSLTKGSYAFRARSFSGQAVSPWSDTAHITVAGIKWIRVTSPTAQDSWTAGTVDTIRWEANRITQVLIRYSVDAGLTWHLALPAGEGVGIGSAEWGRYPWTVPGEISAQVMIQVQEYGGEVCGVSGMFAIIAQQEPKSENRGWCGAGALYAVLIPIGIGVRSVRKKKLRAPQQT